MNRSKRRNFLAAAGLLLLVVGAHPAYSTIWEYIIVDASSSYTAGDTLPIIVTRDPGVVPAVVTVTSSPSGAVSYQGTIGAGATTIPAATNPAAVGSITLHVTTNEGGEAEKTILATEAPDGGDGKDGP